MKKLLFTCAIALFVSISSFALDNIVLDDFENGLVNFTTEVHVNPAASMDIAVVDNPYKTGINLSNKVWEWKRFDTSPDANQSWAGFWAILKNDIPTGYHRIEIKYLRKNATSQLKIKCEGAVTKEMTSVNAATKTNEWETIVFDIYTNGIKNVHVFGFFPDFFEPVDPTSICYIDDITVIFDPTINPPVVPTILTLFDNSASDRFHDQSWVNQTAPSTVVTEHWDPLQTNGDKLPCVTSPVKAGANALKLQWKSSVGGDWMALAASVGWKVFDLKTMTHLKFWVNSPVTIAKTAMPKIHFEAHSGNPNATGKVEMANYMTADLAANTWTEVTVPLADIWATNPLFIAKDLIKGIFFSQNATDNVEHTMYVDEIIFEKVTPALVLFANSASDRFHDQSWINQTAPSTVVTEHWDPLQTNGDKFPCVTSPVKSSTNALKLQWKSVTAGNWMAMVAAVGWTSFDLTDMTHLNFWVNSPAVLAKTALPKLNLEAHSGNPNATGKVDMANYLTADLAANTWTEVSVPLADLWATNALFASKGVIKGLFFSQNATDNVEHIMYMDEFTFVKKTVNALNIPTAEKLNAYYANGEIRIANYNGRVRVYDLAGKSVANGIAINGQFGVSIQKGIYIVNTTRGNAKVVVQ